MAFYQTAICIEILDFQDSNTQFRVNIVYIQGGCQRFTRSFMSENLRISGDKKSLSIQPGKRFCFLGKYPCNWENQSD